MNQICKGRFITPHCYANPSFSMQKPLLVGIGGNSKKNKVIAAKIETIIILPLC